MHFISICVRVHCFIIIIYLVIRLTHILVYILFVDDKVESPLPLLVIAADCVYWEHLFLPFLQTLLQLMALPYCQEIWIAHVRRWKRDSKFFQMCSKKGLCVEVVHEVIDQEVNEHTHVASRRVTRMYRITR